jgi:hypothetical protein
MRNITMLTAVLVSVSCERGGESAAEPILSEDQLATIGTCAFSGDLSWVCQGQGVELGCYLYSDVVARACYDDSDGTVANMFSLSSDDSSYGCEVRVYEGAGPSVEDSGRRGEMVAYAVTDGMVALQVKAGALGAGMECWPMARVKYQDLVVTINEREDVQVEILVFPPEMVLASTE